MAVNLPQLNASSLYEVPGIELGYAMAGIKKPGRKDVLLITDGRFSGGTTGLCVGHVSPEATDGGPIGLIKDGDQILIDIPAGKLELLISDSEIAQRKKEFVSLPPRYTKGVLAKYAKLVGSATHGAVCS